MQGAVRNEPLGLFPATDSLCYDLLNKVQPYFSDHEGLDDMDARLQHTGQKSSPLCHRHTQGLKLRFIWRKRAKNIKFWKKGGGVKRNFCVRYKIE
jgi:hypothetical protein